MQALRKVWRNNVCSPKGLQHPTWLFNKSKTCAFEKCLRSENATPTIPLTFEKTVEINISRFLNGQVPQPTLGRKSGNLTSSYLPPFPYVSPPLFITSWIPLYQIWVLNSLARCLLRNGWYVEAARCWKLGFLFGLYTPQCPDIFTHQSDMSTLVMV